MQINSTLTVSKGLTVKREKDPENEGCEITRAHLKFSALFVDRDQVNALCRQRPGWAEVALFDELNAPLGLWTLTLHGREWTVTGPISGPGGAELRLANATLSGVELTLTSIGGNTGALLSGQLIWTIAGDEAGDAEPLLGRECGCNWVLEDGGQQDLLREEAA